MNFNVNPFSATFWTGLAGVAAVLCGTLGAGNLSQSTENLLIAIGGLFVAIVGHHTTKAAVAASTAKKAAAPPRPLA